MGLVASGPARAGLRRLGYVVAIVVALFFLIGLYFAVQPMCCARPPL
jgi:hypothetical protein